MSKQTSTSLGAAKLFLSNFRHPKESQTCLKGLRFIVSGYFLNFTECDIKKIITYFGGLVSSKVCPDVNFVVLGKGADVELINQMLDYKALFLTKITFFETLAKKVGGVKVPTEKSIFEIGECFPKKNSPLYSKEKSALIAGKVFVLAGIFRKIAPFKLKHIISFHGGKCPNTLSSKTNYLIIGNEAKQAHDKAKALNVTIFTEEGFLLFLLNSQGYAEFLRGKHQSILDYRFKKKLFNEAESQAYFATLVASQFLSFDVLVNAKMSFEEVDSDDLSFI